MIHRIREIDPPSESKENMNTTALWSTRIIDAGDGSGDGIMEFPDSLLTQLGWSEGDKLNLTVDDDGNIRLTKILDDAVS